MIDISLDISPRSVLFNARKVRLEEVKGSLEVWAGKQIYRDGRHSVETYRNIPTRDRIIARFTSDHERGQIAYIGESYREVSEYCKARGIALR